MDQTLEQVTESIRSFVTRRDALLHEDESTFEHHLERFLQFWDTDRLAEGVIQPLQAGKDVDPDAWWTQLSSRDGELTFPTGKDEDMALRYHIMKSVISNPRLVLNFGMALGKYKRDEGIELFRSVVVRPFAEEMTYRLGNAANIASPEARTMQAVPLNRIPGPNETRIFLSHKSADKPLVRRYHDALKTLGFTPWLDESVMAAGANLEREIFKGFAESCAAVFFITESFKDERYLATEIDYAVMQKRKKGKKFAIITLRYHGSAAVPDLLTPFIYKDIANDLEGFNELLRALPIELGSVRWKADVVID